MTQKQMDSKIMMAMELERRRFKYRSSPDRVEKLQKEWRTLSEEVSKLKKLLEKY